MPRGAKKFLTKEIINQRIRHRGFELISEYTKTSEKHLFKCNKNHTWLAKPNNVMSVKNQDVRTVMGNSLFLKKLLITG